MGEEEEKKGPLEKPIETVSGWKKDFVRIRRRYGVLPAILLALAVLAGYVWLNWKTISELPGVKPLLAYFSQGPIEKAEAEHLTVAIAHLDDDNNREQEKLLLVGLREFQGVDTLSVDRTVEWPSAGNEQAREKAAEEHARELLKQTHADVLIWGSVLHADGKSVMRLYWTPSREITRAKTTEQYQATETIKLPELFWTDLKKILGLLTQTRLAELTFGEEGHYVAKRLKPLIDQVEKLAASKEGVWDPETLVRVRFNLAVALSTYGEQSGKNEPLSESAELYRKVMEQWTRERVPLDWAATQNNLGNTLRTLGERESSTATLEQAVEAVSEALKERTRERVPLDWAATQNNLGNALAMLGERETGTDKLEQAVAAYRAALEERTRERVRLLWAQTQENLAGVCLSFFEKTKEPNYLDKALTAVDGSLEEYRRAKSAYDIGSAEDLRKKILAAKASLSATK